MKIIIGSLVGGLILFMWQFFSWTVLDFHRPAQEYTPKQDSILAYLSTQFDSSGGYILPNVHKGASSDDRQKLDDASAGKPWAQILYHKSQNMNMGLNMAKNLATNFIMVLFFCWLVAGFTYNSFGKTFLAALFVGFIIFLHASYTEHIWYETFDLEGHLADYLVGWGATGLWLGWWLNRKKV